MMNVEQCRAARALLNWSAQELAQHAGIGVATVRRFESGSAVVPASVESMARCLTAAGITFIAAGEASPGGGEGVRFNPSSG
jgi:transcriptional regulator with XRE-family HTH domain